jgi:hypothetical protein
MQRSKVVDHAIVDVGRHVRVLDEHLERSVDSLGDPGVRRGVNGERKG